MSERPTPDHQHAADAKISRRAHISSAAVGAGGLLMRLWAAARMPVGPQQLGSFVAGAGGVGITSSAVLPVFSCAFARQVVNPTSNKPPMIKMSQAMFFVKAAKLQGSDQS